MLIIVRGGTIGCGTVLWVVVWNGDGFVAAIGLVMMLMVVGRRRWVHATTARVMMHNGAGIVTVATRAIKVCYAILGCSSDVGSGFELHLLHLTLLLVTIE